MYQVYVLWHTHELKDDYGSHDEIKMIGIFSTKEKAQRAIEQLKDLADFAVILKMDNDGDTVVYSPIPLPHLENQ